jgi:hypothetical protein
MWSVTGAAVRRQGRMSMAPGSQVCLEPCIGSTGVRAGYGASEVWVLISTSVYCRDLRKCLS